jgi:hypothetical protein
MRRGILRSLLVATALVGAEPVRQPIRIDATGFEAREADIAKVCLSAIGELQRYCPALPAEKVVIVRGTKGPITLFQRNDQGEIVVQLDTGKTFWSQYSYQVAHELCHVHCGFRPGPADNQWFEEAVCETASLFCLRAMAKSWATQPPYPNWKSYAPALGKYADDVIARRTYKGEFETKGLPRFYRDHAAELRANATDRELNGAVALALLPFLEEKPTRWAAFHWLNATPRPKNEPFAAYLARWEAHTPAEHQPTVREVRKLFGL